MTREVKRVAGYQPSLSVSGYIHQQGGCKDPDLLLEFFRLFTDLDSRRNFLKIMSNAYFTPSDSSVEGWFIVCRSLFVTALEADDPIWEDLYEELLFGQLRQLYFGYCRANLVNDVVLGFSLYLNINNMENRFSRDLATVNKFSKLIAGVLKKAPELYWWIPQIRSSLYWHLFNRSDDEFMPELDHSRRRFLKIIVAAQDIFMISSLQSLLDNALFEGTDPFLLGLGLEIAEWQAQLKFAVNMLDQRTRQYSEKVRDYLRRQLAEKDLACGFMERPLSLPERLEAGSRAEVSVSLGGHHFHPGGSWPKVLIDLGVVIEVDGDAYLLETDMAGRELFFASPANVSPGKLLFRSGKWAHETPLPLRKFVELYPSLRYTLQVGAAVDSLVRVRVYLVKDGIELIGKIGEATAVISA